MKISLQKLKSILLYFCVNTDPKFLGKVKLMKLFYFLDFDHVRKYGLPVTFDTYINLEHGPIPTTIKNLVDQVCDDIDSSILSDTVYCEDSESPIIKRILPKRKINDEDVKYLSKTELEILEKVCNRFGQKNTQYIEDASHDESPWKDTELLDTIPYSMARNGKECQFSEEDIQFVMNVYN